MIGKSDGYDVASVRSAARKSRLTEVAKPGTATILTEADRRPGVPGRYPHASDVQRICPSL